MRTLYGDVTTIRTDLDLQLISSLDRETQSDETGARTWKASASGRWTPIHDAGWLKLAWLEILNGFYSAYIKLLWKEEHVKDLPVPSAQFIVLRMPRAASKSSYYEMIMYSQKQTHWPEAIAVGL